ncbi:hypothetical protein ACFLZZ_00205 [Nanoarchaeota archaeon]
MDETKFLEHLIYFCGASTVAFIGTAVQAARHINKENDRMFEDSFYNRLPKPIKDNNIYKDGLEATLSKEDVAKLEGLEYQPLRS